MPEINERRRESRGLAHRRGLLGFFLASALIAGEVRAETAYFLVSEIAQPCGACDSYVLPLSDPAAIAHARDLATQGPGAGATIALANAAAGADGINRDLLAPGEPPWSWHVTGLITFADFTIELCDGSPSLIEADPAGFLANTGGVICFWGYTVTAEIPGPVQPIPMGGAIGPLLAGGLALTGLRLARRIRRGSRP